MYDEKKYAEMRQHILMMFKYVEPEDQLQFWQELNEAVTPILIDYLNKSTKTPTYQYPNSFLQELLS